MSLHNKKTQPALPLGAALSWFNVGLRGLMEFGIIAAMAYWGVQTGGNSTQKVLLAVLAPAITFGFWGMVDFRNAGAHAEKFRLIQELAVTAIAAIALDYAGQHVFAWILGLISLFHHSLVYLLGETLLKERK